VKEPANPLQEIGSVVILFLLGVRKDCSASPKSALRGCGVATAIGVPTCSKQRVCPETGFEEIANDIRVRFRNYRPQVLGQSFLLDVRGWSDSC